MTFQQTIKRFGRFLATTSNSASANTPESQMMSASQYEEACKQPVAITTAISLIMMIPVHFISMFMTWTRIDNLFNPHRSQADQRRQFYYDRCA